MNVADIRNGNDIEVLYDKFDKSKKKDNYKLIDIKETDKFRIILFQVDLPDDERRLLNQRLAKKAFLTN